MLTSSLPGLLANQFHRRSESMGFRMVLPDAEPSEMRDAIEAYLGAPLDTRQNALAVLAARLRQAAIASPDLAARTLRPLIVPTLDYSAADTFLRVFRKLKTALPAGPLRKIAILGSFTTSQLASLTELFLFAAGITAEIYQADFGVYRQEILDPASPLHSFRPDILFLAVNRRDLSYRPNADDPPARAAPMDRRRSRRLGRSLANRARPAGMPDHPE